MVVLRVLSHAWYLLTCLIGVDANIPLVLTYIFLGSLDYLITCDQTIVKDCLSMTTNMIFLVKLKHKIVSRKVPKADNLKQFC